jgi:hypothetical protein
MAEEDRRFTAQDLLVIIAGAGLGAPFCAAAAKAALDGNAVQALTHRIHDGGGFGVAEVA